MSGTNDDKRNDLASDRSETATTHEVEPQSPLEEEKQPPYSVYSLTEVWCIVSMGALSSLFSPLSSNIYFPAIPAIASAFHQSVENINITVTVYMIFQGIAPTFWGSVADRKGRRPSFILCLSLLTISCIGLALTPTSAYWLLVLLRCVQSAGSASTVALAFGVIADIVPTKDRGGFIGVSNLGPMVGPCIGPVVGGLLADHLGWRSIFWFLAIASACCTIIIVLFLPETLRSQVGNGSIPAPKWNRALIPIIGRSTLDVDSTRPPPRPLPNPFKLFKEPDLICLLFSTGTLYAAFYAVTATISSLFEEHFPWLSETQIGLCYLSVGGACVIGTVVFGKLLDFQYRRIKSSHSEKNVSVSEKNLEGSQKDVKQSSSDEVDDFPIERARFLTQPFWVVIYSITLIGYGWTIERKTSIAVPLILQFILGLTFISVMISMQTLIVDLFPTQGSSVTAANNLVRCLLGAATVSVITLITNAIGPGWTYTLCGGICLFMTPITLIELKMGPRWRKQRIERERMNQS